MNLTNRFILHGLLFNINSGLQAVLFAPVLAHFADYHTLRLLLLDDEVTGYVMGEIEVDRLWVQLLQSIHLWNKELLLFITFYILHTWYYIYLFDLLEPTTWYVMMNSIAFEVNTFFYINIEIYQH